MVGGEGAEVGDEAQHDRKVLIRAAVGVSGKGIVLHSQRILLRNCVIKYK